MKAYFSIFRIRMQEALQYRAAAWAGVCTQFFWGFMRIMIYQAFYESSDRVMPMEFRQLCTYIWLQQAFLYCFELWSGRDGELFAKITDGSVAYELCRPMELYHHWFARILAGRMGGAALRCVPLLVVTVFLPYPYRLLLPQSAAQLLIFAAALVTGTMITAAVSMLIYVLTFKTLNPSGTLTVFAAISELFAGTVLVLPFMPQKMQSVAMFLPFRYMADFPFRVCSGDIALADSLWQLGAALAWLAALWVIGNWGMKRVLRTAVIQGG